MALSLKSPSLGVTQHPALWSPDFPQAPVTRRPRPLDLLTKKNITEPVEGVKAPFPRLTVGAESPAYRLLQSNRVQILCQIQVMPESLQFSHCYFVKSTSGTVLAESGISK